MFNFPDNHNKIVQDLLREHNKYLDRIRDGISIIVFALVGIQFTTIIKR